jgi:hypothetical protein
MPSAPIAGALAYRRAAFTGPWPEEPETGMNKGSGSGAVDSDSRLGMGVGHYWGWEAANGAEE